MICYFLSKGVICLEINVLAINVENCRKYGSMGREERNNKIRKKIKEINPDIFILTEVSKYVSVKFLKVGGYKVFGNPKKFQKTLGSLIGIRKSILKDEESYQDNTYNKKGDENNWPFYRACQVDVTLVNDTELRILGIYPAAYGGNFLKDIFVELTGWMNENEKNKTLFIAGGDINCDTDGDLLDHKKECSCCEGYSFDTLEEQGKKYDVWLSPGVKREGTRETNPFKSSRIDRIFTNLEKNEIKHDWKLFKGLSDHAAVITKLKL